MAAMGERKAKSARDALLILLHNEWTRGAEVTDAVIAHPAEVLAAMVEAGKLTQIAPRHAYIGGACDQFEAAYPCVLGARAFVHIPPVTGSARTEGPPCRGRHLMAETRAVRVLMVDDDEALAASIKRTLILAGLEVTYVATASAAIDTGKTEHFDVLLCDWDLGPGQTTGLGVCEALRRYQSEARFVIMSGLTRDVPEWVTFANKGDWQQIFEATGLSSEGQSVESEGGE